MHEMDDKVYSHKRAQLEVFFFDDARCQMLTCVLPLWSIEHFCVFRTVVEEKLRGLQTWDNYLYGCFNCCSQSGCIVGFVL